jgi:hypothetical protein
MPKVRKPESIKGWERWGRKGIKIRGTPFDL